MPQDIVTDKEKQKKLTQKYHEGILTCRRKAFYPKFGKAIDSEKRKYYPEKVEYLDEYIDKTDGKIYAIRELDGSKFEFEECDRVVIYAEQIEENNIICLLKKAYWGGIPFDFDYNFFTEEDFPNTLLGRIINNELRKFIDIRVPERITPNKKEERFRNELKTNPQNNNPITNGLNNETNIVVSKENQH